eukprot:746011-Hanusia_phi.AAC.1
MPDRWERCSKETGRGRAGGGRWKGRRDGVENGGRKREEESGRRRRSYEKRLQVDVYVSDLYLQVRRRWFEYLHATHVPL